MSSLSGSTPPPDEKVEWNPPEDKYGERLKRIILEDDAIALEQYLAPFHHRRVMPCTFGNPNPWETAIYYGKFEVLRVLMKYVGYKYRYDGEWPVDDGYPDRRYLFHKACQQCHVDIIHFLLKLFGPEVARRRAPDDDGCTPILLVCRAIGARPEAPRGMTIEKHLARCEALVELLLDLGADASDRYVSDGGGVLTATTLSYAAELAPSSLIALLLDHGADINARVKYEAVGGGVGNSTLLHIATRNLNADVVRFLLERPEGRAMASVRDDEGRTPLHCLATRRACHERTSRAHYPFQDRAQFVRRAVEIAEALLPYSDLEAPGGPEGKTPLFLVSEFSDWSHEENEPPSWDAVPRFFLDRGADPTTTDKEGNTALAALVRRRPFDPAAELLEHFVKCGAPVDTTDRDGNTLLHMALKGGHKVETVRFLLYHGVRADACNKDGDTPVHLAAAMHKGLLVGLPTPADPVYHEWEGFGRRHKEHIEGQGQILDLLVGPDGDPAVYDFPDRAGRTPRQIRDRITGENRREAECIVARRRMEASVVVVGTTSTVLFVAPSIKS
ncbi:ankyrin protein [Apiospora rasikravindrae]|uniref:Ankyrin protein n=1 Tax=Apiospora rasikravindrae TaxID=990691 RepID=A0ABR1TYH0_9PEZI